MFTKKLDKNQDIEKEVTLTQNTTNEIFSMVENLRKRIADMEKVEADKKATTTSANSKPNSATEHATTPKSKK